MYGCAFCYYPHFPVYFKFSQNKKSKFQKLLTLKKSMFIFQLWNNCSLPVFSIMLFFLILWPYLNHTSWQRKNGAPSHETVKGQSLCSLWEANRKVWKISSCLEDLGHGCPSLLKCHHSLAYFSSIE